MTVPVTRAVAEPRATYRLQLRNGIGFAEAEAILPYLVELGVSHVYLSPILRATPGSTHGYDVVDPRQVDPALGGDEGFRSFARAARGHGLGILLDIVPNHMAIGPDNPWWWDVLANGPASRYADHFDVDWEHPEPHLRQRVLMPVLGDHYGRVLEAGAIRLGWDGRELTIAYEDHRFPVSMRSIDGLLHTAAERAGSPELAFLADACGDLPPAATTDPEGRLRRDRDVAVIGARLAALAAEDPRVGDAMAAVVATTNADADALDGLLERQNYRLAWWRAARRDLGYRRFFDVTTLVGLRTEDEAVFRDTHVRILEWLADGTIDGVRIDHPDGLRDPEAYLRALRWAAPRAWIVVEKILGAEELLRRSWPVAGTTGYDALVRVTRLLADPAGEAPLSELHARLTGDARPFGELAQAAKREVLRDVLGSELGRLTALLLDVLERHRRHRDHTRHDLHEALRALLAELPVYRTYVRPGREGEPGHVAPDDQAVVEAAVLGAKASRPDLPGDLFDAIADLLLLRITGPSEAEFVWRFQQLSGPATAKGVEDTALYRDIRLTALCEVGGDPDRWSDDPATVHSWFSRAQAEHPLGLFASSTHDTKRSEDVRARLLVLSAIPHEWSAAVDRWADLLAPGADAAVDGHAISLLLQTLVGAWPIEKSRLVGYLEKALREAKLRTSWTEPDPDYEAAVADLARRALTEPAIRDDVAAFVGRILVPGRIVALVQQVLKLTLPGVPDLYQGTELWDHSLVDPDNRRPVDFGLRATLLATVARCSVDEVAARLGDADDAGLPKLWVTRRLLALRAAVPEAFGSESTYQPLDVRDAEAASEPAFAFVRGTPPDARRLERIAVVVPRPSAAPDRPVDPGAVVELPPGGWRDELTEDAVDGGPRPLTELLARFPVAILRATG